jgi:hypothetical protein
MFNAGVRSHPVPVESPDSPVMMPLCSHLWTRAASFEAFPHEDTFEKWLFELKLIYEVVPLK